MVATSAGADRNGGAAGGRAAGAGIGVAFGLLLAALLLEALLRPRFTSTESFNYVDVARHVARGDGIVQSTLGYNAARFPAEGGWPVPFVAQPPLYPVLAAALVRAGLEPLRAALAVSLLALGAAWLLAWRLAGALWDRGAAALAVLALALPAAVPDAAWRVPSELPALAFALLAMLLHVRAARREGAARAAGWGLAGLAAGAAFATRYLFALALPVGALFLPWRRRPRRSLADLAAFAAGGALAAVPVLARNLALTGSALGGGRNPSEVSALGSLRQLGMALAGSPPRAALAALALAGLLAGVVALARRGVLADLWRGERALPAAWAVAYLVALVALRSRVQFDLIGLRLLAPALAFGAVAAAPLLARALPAAAARAGALAAVVALALAAGAVVRTARTPAVTDAQRVQRSPRLAWLRDHTGPRDLVIGHLPVDVPWYFRGPDGGPRPAASIARAPYMPAVGPSDLATLVRRQQGRFERFYLVLRRDGMDEEKWTELGPFLAGLAAGRAFPGVIPVVTLPDAFVFRLEPGAPGVGALAR